MNSFLVLIFLSLFFCCCETATFDKDKRQIAAKDAVMDQLHGVKNFDIVSFKEDTLSSGSDTVFRRPIRYTLDFVFTDSTGVVQARTAEVLFTPDGKSLMTARISRPNQ